MKDNLSILNEWIEVKVEKYKKRSIVEEKMKEEYKEKVKTLEMVLEKINHLNP